MLLSVNGVSLAYGPAQALFDVSLKVEEGEVVTLLGANGAGKSSILKTVVGMYHPFAGTIEFGGQRIEALPTDSIVPMGLALVPEDRGVFPGLTVFENLQMGTVSWRRRGMKIDADLDKVFALFPRLKERRNQLAWSLSGGEQQMLATARGIMSRPKLLMLDEPSIGLAPLLVGQVFKTISEIQKTGTSILLVEQNARMALNVATRAYVLETGKIALEGSPKELLQNEEVKNAYLGA
ncbi:MAG TPA: ABC transporter ATP-binding protein [Bacillota bacterium]|jgi:branched-chain amino acid transport system ATP-binding protein